MYLLKTPTELWNLQRRVRISAQHQQNHFLGEDGLYKHRRVSHSHTGMEVCFVMENSLLWQGAMPWWGVLAASIAPGPVRDPDSRE